MRVEKETGKERGIKEKWGWEKVGECDVLEKRKKERMREREREREGEGERDTS